MLTPGEQLGPYEIRAAIGAGGMGEVYLAHDQRLNRDVAIKVLPADRATDDAARQRFLREARAASALNHPNIITIYETDSFKGMAFIAMEYVRGKSLAGLLHERALSDADAVQYAIQISDALAKAHAAGIIHRDLKPGNIMITDDGLVKVLDFGLARVEAQPATASDDSPTASGSFLSKPGTTLGTFYYMSPEQARGEVADTRSDIFSFGVVLFEMLTRELPFDGDNLLAMLHALHFGEPKAIRTLRPDLADEIAAVVERCLQKLPKDRYQSAAEINRDLKAAVGQSSSTMGSAAGLKRWAPATKGAEPKPELADTNIRKRKFKVAAAAAIVAALIVAIAIPALRHKIISLGSRSTSTSPATVETVPDNPFALQQQAQAYLERWDVPTNLDRSITLLNRAIELDHDYAPAYASLTFAYYEKNRLNADPQWVKQATQSAARALQLNGDLADAHLAGGVAAMLNSHNDEAEREFRKAADLDPKSSKPYRWLGFMFNTAGKSKEAETELARALTLDPQDWRAYMNQGVLYYKTARYPEAAAAWEKVSKLTPDNLIVLNNLAAVYHMMDRYEDAASALQRSLEIKPDADTYGNLGTLRFFQGRYAEAVPAFEKATTMEPNSYIHWGNLGDAYRWAPGRAAQAKSAYQNAIRLAREEMRAHPDDLDLRSSLALYLAKNGDKQGALEQIKEVARAPKKEASVLFNAAVVYELSGERDQALAALSAAMKDGYGLQEIKNEPELVALRADARYQTILSAISSK